MRVKEKVKTLSELSQKDSKDPPPFSVVVTVLRLHRAKKTDANRRASNTNKNNVICLITSNEIQSVPKIVTFSGILYQTDCLAHKIGN